MVAQTHREKYYFAIMAIVTIVAVTGFVVMFAGKGDFQTISADSAIYVDEEGNIGGEAIRRSREIRPISEPVKEIYREPSITRDAAAESCDADEVCEMNEGIVTGVFQATDIFVTDGLDVDEITQLRGYTHVIDADLEVDNNLIVGQDISADNIISQDIITDDLDVWDNNDYSIFHVQSAFGNNVVVMNAEMRNEELEGAGNAYACLDETGTLFRSITPCNQVDPELNVVLRNATGATICESTPICNFGSYEIILLGANDEVLSAVISVNDDIKTFDIGNTKTVAGLTLTLEDLFISTIGTYGATALLII